ncbi:Glycosyltransferase [Psidium guajava]|nr:Glycosyltransferase [Psidium guajava]
MASKPRNSSDANRKRAIPAYMKATSGSLGCTVEAHCL